MPVKKINERMHYVGVMDPKLRVFDIIMESPHGTSYNSYLIRGDHKTVLVETVKAPFFDEYVDNLKQVVSLDQIDYILASHTEPDHSGCYEQLLKLCPNATVLASTTGITFLEHIINAPFKSHAVGDGEQIDLGGLTLQFMYVPMLHWPDSIFTYIPEMKALFSCDSFGCHYADDRVFNDQIEGDFEGAYRYYFEHIMGPYMIPHMRNALRKIEELPIQFIGNGHGPVLRTNVEKYLDMYRRWTQEPIAHAPRVVIAYVSAYGYTRALAEAIAEGLKDQGITEIEMFDLTSCDRQRARAAVANSDAFLLGSPTLVGDALPPVWEMLLDLNPVIHRNKIAGAFGSYGWSGEAVPNLVARMQQLKLRLPLLGLRVRFKPSPAQLEEAHQYGKDFALSVLP